MQFELLICFPQLYVLSSVVVLLFSAFQIGSPVFCCLHVGSARCQTDATEVQRASQLEVLFCCIQRVESENIVGQKA